MRMCEYWWAWWVCSSQKIISTGSYEHVWIFLSVFWWAYFGLKTSIGQNTHNVPPIKYWFSFPSLSFSPLKVEIKDCYKNFNMIFTGEKKLNKLGKICASHSYFSNAQQLRWRLEYWVAHLFVKSVKIIFLTGQQ